MTATITHLFLRPAARAPVVPVGSATLVTGAAIGGDHAGGGRRAVTVLDLGAWRAACAELGLELDPALRRANVVVDGLDPDHGLARSVGRRLRLGATATLVIAGETRPCELLDGPAHAPVAPGLSRALRSGWRGGVHGRIAVGGVIRVGDPVRFEP